MWTVGQTDRQTDMTKLIVACRNLATAPTKSVCNASSVATKAKEIRHVQSVQEVNSARRTCSHPMFAVNTPRLAHQISLLHYNDPAATAGVFITRGPVQYNKEQNRMCHQSHIVTNSCEKRHAKQGQLSRLQLTSPFKQLYELLHSFKCRTFREADHHTISALSCCSV